MGQFHLNGAWVGVFLSKGAEVGVCVLWIILWELLRESIFFPLPAQTGKLSVA